MWYSISYSPLVTGGNIISELFGAEQATILEDLRTVCFRLGQSPQFLRDTASWIISHRTIWYFRNITYNNGDTTFLHQTVDMLCQIKWT